MVQVELFMPGSYKRQDHLYRRAKAEGYRSRAAYKLLEIDKKYGILKHGYKILDLGSWPGGWLQVAAEKVGSSGVVVGIDLVPVDKLPADNVFLIVGAAGDEDTLREARQAAGGQFDVVLSDMSPKLSGIPEVDSTAAVACAEAALWAAKQTLKAQGNLVIKVFKSAETETFVKNTRPLFNKLIRSKLSSTRKTSNEFYLICLGFVRARG